MEQYLQDPRLAILPALIMLGMFLKNHSPVSNKYIPSVVLIGGVVLGWYFYNEDIGMGSMVVGFMYGCSAIGLHSGTKNTLKQENTST